MFAFDREPHGTLRNEQKQFPELSDDRKRGFGGQMFVEDAASRIALRQGEAQQPPI
jgi:hypothetical protein